MSVCATCHEPGIRDYSQHHCPGPQYADIVFTRHRGRAITVDTTPAPARTRIALRAFADRYAYLHMPAPDQVVFADQVVYRVTGYDTATSALELELVEDWRTPVTLVVEEKPLAAAEYEALKAKWLKEHGNGQAAHHVEVLNDEEGPGA